MTAACLMLALLAQEPRFAPVMIGVVLDDPSRYLDRRYWQQAQAR